MKTKFKVLTTVIGELGNREWAETKLVKSGKRPAKVLCINHVEFCLIEFKRA